MNVPRFLSPPSPRDPGAIGGRIDTLGLAFAAGMTLALSVMVGRIAMLQLAVGSPGTELEFAL